MRWKVRLGWKIQGMYASYPLSLESSHLEDGTGGKQMRCVHVTNFIFINPYTTAFPYGNGMVLHFYKQQESSTTKTVDKVINKGLKAYV